jgi:hypothetical protein
MQSSELTTFGKVLEEMMAEHGVRDLDELAKMAAETGYPFDLDELIGHMHDRDYKHVSQPFDPNVVGGPAEALSLSPEEKGRLAVAFMFNK